MTLCTEKAFPFTTQNLRNPQMASEVKPTKKGYLLIISKYQQTGKKKKKKNWSQQVYVHIHIKKRAVSGVGEGLGERERKKEEKDLGN